MARDFHIRSFSLLAVRVAFILVAAGLAVRVITSDSFGAAFGDFPWMPWVAFLGILGLTLAVISFDAAFRRKRLDVFTSVFFGMIIGLTLTYIAQLALFPLLPPDETGRSLANQAMAVIGMVLCYGCVSVLLQTRDNFRFIIPYVEFSREIKGNKPSLLDTSVVIDGRIADVMETGALPSRLIMPRFIINELQNIADSSDKMRRMRGRRGLDILNRMRKDPQVDLTVYEHEPPELDGQAVDMKLVLLAKHVDGNIITNDYNLNKVAKLQGVDVVNLNDLANALKPVFLPGEHIDVQVVKPGEEPRQGVGYLDDGTMIVIDGGREHIGETVHITVTSILQTSAGRMVFGRCDTPAKQSAKS
ncbi:MAG: TRAM domain-containing protein [Planctomycetota bacterium]|nr:MAG: TRAM domain-containing protein [Planctomycetota bacterium]REJ86695.1 MAG: TRAM domain-containing protein [Planctomycetota bacterium]REK27133.1 MAG: TRAM domain-containing protein [Planctomycetota bacterium]REK37870.1 MAG: TRAM domain-containing protein [Planctomycetota bacterium]